MGDVVMHCLICVKPQIVRDSWHFWGVEYNKRFRTAAGRLGFGELSLVGLQVPRWS